MLPCHVQVHALDRNAFFGLSDNSNGANGLTYYLYPPPAYNSVDAESESWSAVQPLLSCSPDTFLLQLCTYLLQFWS